MDQTIEETINKDTQTPGGTKGFSTREGAVKKVYITAEYLSRCVRYMRAMVDITKDSFTHPDITPKRIKRYAANKLDKSFH